MPGPVVPPSLPFLPGSRPGAGRALELLLVEDEPADASLLRAALREAGSVVQLHHAVDAAEALQRLRRPAAAPPDLLLLDINLPRVNGRELLATLKADPQLAPLPVVVVSTSDAEADVQAAYALGAAGYLVKPVDMDVLIKAMASLCHYWGQVMRLPVRG